MFSAVSYDYSYENNLTPEQTFALIACTVVIWVVFYLVYAFCQYRIAKKLNDENAWWAWVPILNGAQIFRLGEQKTLWYWLCFVPIVNFFAVFVAFVLMIIAWIKIINKLGKPSWHVIFLLFFGPVYIIYLAL